MQKLTFVLLVFTCLALFNASAQFKTTTQLRKQNINLQNKKNLPIYSSAKPRLRFTIINSTESGFGYNILNHDRIIISQPSVPCLPGNRGFATEKDAATVANLVIKKLNNKLTPTVTQQELTFLKIKF